MLRTLLKLHMQLSFSEVILTLSAVVAGLQLRALASLVGDVDSCRLARTKKCHQHAQYTR